MKTKWNLSLLLPILLFGLALAVSCTKDDNNDVPCAQISSSVVTEMRTVGDFQNILLEGIGTILLTQGPQQPLRIETHREILDRLDTRVVGEELQISLTGCINGQVDRLEIFVTIPEIRRIQVDGVGNVIAQNDFDLDDLNVELNGVGGITLQGSSNLLEVLSAGVGDIHAFDMLTDTCIITIAGMGNVEVWAESLLDVTISGAGNVYYRGNPMINLTVSGTGNLIDLN